MFILLAILAVITVVLVIIGIMPSEQPRYESKKKIPGPPKPPPYVRPQPAIVSKKEESPSASLELEALTSKYADLEQELELLKKSEAQLHEEVARRQQWVEKSEESIRKFRSETEE